MYRTILVVFLILCFAHVAFAKAEKSSKHQGYQPEVVYEGLYRSDRLYQHNPYVDKWNSSKIHRTVASLSCLDARWALSKTGEWVGVLTETGACASPEEGQLWMTGNHLNFLIAEQQ